MSAKKHRCPTCRHAAARDAHPQFPFCSERCRLIDLGRWLGEEYRIPEQPDTSPPSSDDDYSK